MSSKIITLLISGSSLNPFLLVSKTQFNVSNVNSLIFLLLFYWSNNLSFILAREYDGWNIQVFSKQCFNNLLDLNNEYNNEVLPLRGFPIHKVVEWKF